MYMYMVQYDVQTMTVHMKHAKIKKKKNPDISAATTIFP